MRTEQRRQPCVLLHHPLGPAQELKLGQLAVAVRIRVPERLHGQRVHLLLGHGLDEAAQPLQGAHEGGDEDDHLVQGQGARFVEVEGRKADCVGA